MYSPSLTHNVAVLADGYPVSIESDILKPVILDFDYLGVSTPIADGGGTVSGIITTKGNPQVDATVDLFEAVSRTLVSSVKTGANGAFEFPNLNKNYEFFIVVRGLPEWEWRAKSRFKPV